MLHLVGILFPHVTPLHLYTGTDWWGWYCSNPLTTSTSEGSGISLLGGGHFKTGRYPVTIVQKTGWAWGLFWTGAEDLVPTRIRPSDRPACSESLYRQSYPGTPFTKGLRWPVFYIISILKINKTNPIS